MPVIQPYFRPYTDKRSSMFASAWMSFVGTRTELNMMAIKQQMKLMDPSLVNQQILRAQQNIVELQKLKFSLQQKSNSARSSWLRQSQPGSEASALKTEIGFGEKVTGERQPSSGEFTKAENVARAIGAFDHAWPGMRGDVEAWLATTGSTGNALYTKVMERLYDKTNLTQNATNDAVLAAMVSDQMEKETSIDTSETGPARLDAVLVVRAEADGKFGTQAGDFWREKAETPAAGPPASMEREESRIRAAAEALGMEYDEETDSFPVDLGSGDFAAQDTLSQEYDRLKKHKALAAEQRKGKGRGRGGAPSEYDPSDLESMIKEEQEALRKLRQRQERMIERGPGAIFSPFSRSLVKETPFTYSPPGFRKVEKGKVYSSQAGTVVGITKAGAPFYYTAQGEEVQPNPGTKEYEHVVELLRSIE